MSSEVGRGGMEILGPEAPLRFSLLISVKKEPVLKVCPKYFNENVYARSNGYLLFLLSLMRPESTGWTWVVFCHMISLYLRTNFPLTVKLL